MNAVRFFSFLLGSALIGIFLAEPSSAQSNAPSNAQQGTPPGLVQSTRYFVSLGTGVMFERGNDGLSDSTRLPLSFGTGARFQTWEAQLQYALFRTSDGNQTVAVAREVESLLAWGRYEWRTDEASWAPYVGLALGAARTNVQTSLGATRETHHGSWQGTWSAAAGLCGFWASWLRVRPEVRFELAQDYKIKDARTGVFIELDFLY